MENVLLNQEGKVCFERAIFISWYCSLGDCTYCYMSTQKNLIPDPEKAKRRTSSILAEAYLCKKLGWKVGNLAAGYGSYTEGSIVDLCSKVFEVTKQKMWLNIGVLANSTLQKLKPYLEGVYGAVETTNEEVHEKVAPNKPVAPIERMFRRCDGLTLKKAMTFIVGLGEDIGDFDSLKKFIEKHKIDKVTFYALNPVAGTEFENAKGPTQEYYLDWIKKTRNAFPDLEIVVGPWVNRVSAISKMLESGANSITKFPAIKLFNTEHARTMEEEIQKAGYELQGTLTEMPEIDLEEIRSLNLNNELKEEIIAQLEKYLGRMAKAK